MHEYLDPLDPVQRAYHRYLRKAVIYGFTLSFMAICLWVVGLPHLQTSHRYVGAPQPNGVATAQQKIDAWYLGVTGWRHVCRGQYGDDGCPWILFIPVEECFSSREPQG